MLHAYVLESKLLKLN